MTLTELNQLIGDRGALFDKISAAALIAAEAYRSNGAATAAQKAWAREVFRDPGAWKEPIYIAVLAANSTATVAQVTGATDSAVQAAVANAAALFAG